MRRQRSSAYPQIVTLLSSTALLSAVVWIVSVVTFLVVAHHGGGFRLGEQFPRFQDIGIYNTRFFLYHSEAFFQDLPGYSLFAYPPVDALIYNVVYWLQDPVSLYVILSGLWTMAMSAFVTRMLSGYAGSVLTRVLAALSVVCFSFPAVFLAERANIELFVWILIALGTYLYFRKALYWAAVCVGLAAALKLYPILLLGLFLANRREIKAGLAGVATFVGSTLIALWYTGPTVAIALRGSVQNILYFKHANGETSRSVEMIFDHSLFSPLKLAGLLGHMVPTHWSKFYYLIVGVAFVALFLKVRTKPFLNRLMFLSIATVILPPVSYEYTLVHLYLPIALLAAGMLRSAHAEKADVRSADLLALGSGLLLTLPLALLGNGTFLLAGQIQLLCLLALGAVATFRAWTYELPVPDVAAAGRVAWQRFSRIQYASRTVLPTLPGSRSKGASGTFSAILLGALSAAGEALEGRTWLCVAIMVVCYVPVVILQAKSKLLINDELYTVHIAEQPTVRHMLWMAREIDLHPPMHYLFQRWALTLAAPRWFDSRLPSMLAGWAVTIGVFRFTQRRVGNLLGLLAACVFWFTPALDFAWVNRPYELWLGFLLMVLLARDVAHQPDRPRWAIPLVCGMTLCMVGTHLLGIACLSIIVVAEWWRSRRTGRLDWALVSALLLPALLGLGFYYQFHHLSQNAFPETQQPSWYLLTMMYIALFGNSAGIIGGCVLGFSMLFGARAPELETDLETHRAARRFTSDDLLLLVLLLVLPIGLFVPALALNLQFWFRYAGASMPAMAMLAAWFVARKLPLPRALATLVIACGVSYMAYVAIVDTPPPTNALSEQGGRWPVSLGSLLRTMPIVAASPMTFIEMADREPKAVAERTYYLTDVRAAYKYAHYTLFENEDKISKLMDLPTKTSDLQTFLRANRQFYVVGDYNRPEVWLLRKLDADGHQVNYLGKFVSSYETEDLYLVTVKDSALHREERPWQDQSLPLASSTEPR